MRKRTRILRLVFVLAVAVSLMPSILASTIAGSLTFTNTPLEGLSRSLWESA